MQRAIHELAYGLTARCTYTGNERCGRSSSRRWRETSQRQTNDGIREINIFFFFINHDYFHDGIVSENFSELFSVTERTGKTKFHNWTKNYIKLFIILFMQSIELINRGTIVVPITHNVRPFVFPSNLFWDYSTDKFAHTMYMASDRSFFRPTFSEISLLTNSLIPCTRRQTFRLSIPTFLWQFYR